MTRSTRLLPHDAYPNKIADNPAALDHMDAQLRSMQFMIPDRPGLYADAQGDIWIHIGDERWIDNKNESYLKEYTPALAMFAPFTNVLETRTAIHDHATAISTARNRLRKVQLRASDAMFEHEEYISSLSDTLPNTITDDELSFILEDIYNDTTSLITRIDSACSANNITIDDKGDNQ